MTVKSGSAGAELPLAGALFGVSGWDYPDWRGPLYPSSPPRGYRPLRLLGRFLDFMEVNATFYHPASARGARRWLGETPPEFGFVLKAWRGWTHEGLVPGGESLRQFREGLDPLLESGRGYGVLLQFPPWFGFDDFGRSRLRFLRRAFQPARCFVEVRSRAFYHPPFFEFLEAEGLAFVNVDLPPVRQLPRLTTINTGPVAFLRLHGRNRTGWARRDAGRDDRYDHRYTEEEVRELVESVRHLLERAPTVLVGANNHFQAHAPAAAILLKSLLQGSSVAAPASLIASHPELEGHAHTLEEEDPHGQPSPRGT